MVQPRATLPTVQLFQTKDWTAGLNLRDDAFQLPDNQTPDALNVRILPQGGFERRMTVQRINSTALSATPKNIWHYFGSGVQQIVVQQGSDAAFSTGGNFTAINPDALTTTGIMRATTMERASVATSDRLYVQRNAEQVAWKWDGTTATVLADAHGAYNDNYAAPAGGKMPIARYICTHMGYMFHAYTVEAGTVKKNRVRFSHPGEPEDYRTDDHFDIGDSEADEITGIASMGDVLYVFRHRDVWVVTGFDANTFQQVLLTAKSGAVSQEAVSVCVHGLGYFDARQGVFLIPPQGGQPMYLWDELHMALEMDDIPPAFVDKTTVCWQMHRLFVSVPWEASTTNARTFIYDPMLMSKGRKMGGWYAYDYGVGPMVDWQPLGSSRMALACAPALGRVWQLDADDTTDLFDTTNTTFDSYLTTSWYEVSTPGVFKRWRRPSFVMDADMDTTIQVRCYVDYSMLTTKRSFNIIGKAATGTGLIWGVGHWGVDVWGDTPMGEQAVVRGSALGRAKAVALKFIGPTDQHWAINAIELRYIVQRIR